MISLTDSLDELLLTVLQVEVGFAAVCSLTTLTTQRDDSHVATLDGGIELVGSKLLLVSTCRGHQ